MARLTEPEKQRIRAALSGIAARTGAELLVVTARACDRYAFPPLLAATLVALLAPLPIWWFALIDDPLTAYAVQLGAFIAVAGLLQWPPLLRLILPHHIRRAHAHRLAHDLFHRFMMAGARKNGAVLLFVADFERHVEVLADHRVHGEVADGTWARIVAAFTAEIGSGAAGAILAAVEAIGAELTRHLPRAEGEPPAHEHLIEL
ncbi:MAG TPA: hypothetical protein VEU47_20515 [Candidatus Cybelea sp.]|nr:hypothetical protein [Candidatus Cybelea sp.]